MTQNYNSFDPPVVVKIYKTYQLLSALVTNFPKPQRYSLGQSLDNSLLKMLEDIYEANATPFPLREACLLKALAKCDLIKLLTRLGCENGIIGNTQFYQLMANFEEIGRMLRGWINYIRSQPGKK